MSGRLEKPATGVAIIGCGYWGVNYVRVFSELPDARVVVVCDSDPMRLKEIRGRFPDVAVTSDPNKALSMPGVEAVVIATEASSHYMLAQQALELGKHVLIEKPVTLDVDEAQQLVDAVDERGQILLVGHTFLYNTGIRRMKEYVVSGDVGRVYCAYARRTGLGPIRHDVNAIWDLATHDVAIFNYLLDAKPEWVSAVGARVLLNEREDVGFITLTYPRGVVAHIHVSWADPHKVREVVVVGSDKRVVFDDLAPTARVRVFDRGVKPLEEPLPQGGFADHHFQMRDGDVTIPSVRFVEPLKHQCGHFLHAIRRGERLATDARQGRDVVEVMKAIESSMAQSGVPVPVGSADERRVRHALRQDDALPV